MITFITTEIEHPKKNIYQKKSHINYIKNLQTNDNAGVLKIKFSRDFNSSTAYDSWRRVMRSNDYQLYFSLRLTGEELMYEQFKRDETRYGISEDFYCYILLRPGNYLLDIDVARINSNTTESLKYEYLATATD